MGLADLAKYTGADRAPLLYDGAKKEGKFLWYTSLIANKEIVKIFESKYPGVTVETYRASGTQLATRVLAEAQSKRYLGDVIETSPPGLMVLRDSQLLLPYTSPYLVRIPGGRQTKSPARLGFLDNRPRVLYRRRLQQECFALSRHPEELRRSVKAGAEGKMSDQQRRCRGSLYRRHDQIKGRGFHEKIKGTGHHGPWGQWSRLQRINGVRRSADIVYGYS